MTTKYMYKCLLHVISMKKNDSYFFVCTYLGGPGDDAILCELCLCYIVHVPGLHVGVRSQFRRQGLGRQLMSQLFSHIAGLPTCQLVYLHVLSTNSQALGQSLIIHVGLSFFVLAYRLS